ncbi:hypothetical protein ACFY1U_48675 [Streptomyces sp. NPDC001351]
MSTIPVSPIAASMAQKVRTMEKTVVHYGDITLTYLSYRRNAVRGVTE